MTRAETEPLGITYDRVRLAGVQGRLVERFGWRRVIEVGAGGAKARPSLYSLGFALAGCEVDLLGADPSALGDFEELGLGGRVRLLDAAAPGDAGRRWDVAWNFVTAAARRDFPRAVASMARLAPHVMTVHCNGLHVGQPWHRLLHALFGLPWTHAPWSADFPGTVGLAYRRLGLPTAAAGFFDAPGWPDPPGFRDIRLHRSGIADREDEVSWEAPILEIHRTGRVPAPLRVLGVLEDMQPLPVRMLLAHLYFHVGGPR